MKRRVLSVLALALTAAFLVNGCGSTPQDGSTGEADTGTKTTDGGDSADADTGTDENADVQADAGIERISEEGITWNMFKGSHTCMGILIDDWNETLTAQQMEEKTGVHIDFTTPILGEENTQLNLLISSGSIPDFISGGVGGYEGGAVGLLNDGISVDIAEYLDLMPNFKKQLEASEFRQKEVYTDDGRITGLPIFFEDDEETEIFAGVLIRKDLLDDVGMDVPETYDEWHDVLTAFKEQCGITKGFVPGTTGMSQNNMWTIGYGFGYRDYWGSDFPFYQIDGKVLYAPVDATESFRAYLEMMEQWYKEGLIDPDFQSVTDINAQISTYSSADCGSCVTAYSMAGMLASIGSEFKEDFEYVVAPMPVLEKGTVTHEYYENGKIQLNAVIISADCEDLESALRYWDQYYTREASDLSCWGVEGTTYEVAEDGTKTWMDNITNNPNENFINMRYATVGTGYPGSFDVGSTMVDEFNIAADRLYREQGDNQWRISGNISLLEDELDVYNRYMPDINTYLDEMTVKYITGQESFDGFDNFIQTVKDMNVEECKSAFQSALDRYNAR